MGQRFVISFTRIESEPLCVRMTQRWLRFRSFYVFYLTLRTSKLFIIICLKLCFSFHQSILLWKHNICKAFIDKFVLKTGLGKWFLLKSRHSIPKCIDTLVIVTHEGKISPNQVSLLYTDSKGGCDPNGYRTCTHCNPRGWHGKNVMNELN